MEKTTSSHKKRKSRVIDPNQPKRPTTAFNFFMKRMMTQYSTQNPGLQTADVIRVMSADWRNFSPEEKKIYDDAAAQSRREYEEKLKDYQQTEDYRSFQQLKRDVKDGVIDAHEVSKPSRAKKSVSAITQPPKKKTPASKKLNFEVFTNEFKEFNRKRDEEYRKLRKKVNSMEEEIEDIEERLEKLVEKKAKLMLEQSDAKVIESQSKRVMERYRKVFLASLPDKLLKDLHLTATSDVPAILAALKIAEKKPSLNQEIKNYIASQKFN